MTSRGLITLSDRTRLGSARAPGGGFPWYSDPVTVRKVDENSTATTVVNSNTETDIAELDVPALTLASTGAARLSATGTISKGSTGGTVTFRIMVSDDSSTDTVLATSGINVAGSTSPHAWAIEAWLLGKQPNINRAWGVVDVATAGAGGTIKPSTFTGVGFSTMGLDETDGWTVRITAQMSVASTSFSVTRQAAILEGVN